MIGSGPTVGERSTADDARAILARWRIDPPCSVLAAFAGKSCVVPPDDPRLGRAETRVVAAPARSLAAAARLAEAAGCEARILGDAIEGEARDVARTMAAEIFAIRNARGPGDRPLVLLSGGELTVTRRGNGIGGPNAEFVLALALALDGAKDVHALACDSDGIDGAADVAGAVVGPDTLARAASAGLDPAAALDRNDAHTFFASLGDQVVTGPTLTNVNDIRAILIDGCVR